VNRAKSYVCASTLACGLAWSLSAVGAGNSVSYSVVGRIQGTGKSWDYAVVDEMAQRFYVAQQGVTALDLGSGTLTTSLLSAKRTHGLAVLGDGRIAVDEADAKNILIFNGLDGTLLSTIPTAADNPVDGNHALDALVWEPRSGLIVAINGESGLVLLADPKLAKVVGTIAIGGHPEFAAVGDHGRIYINDDHQTHSEIVAIDVRSRKVVRHIPLSGCEGPTGLAYDRVLHLLISVCGDNGVTKFIDSHSGHESVSLMVGKGADAVIYDAQRQTVFIPNAEDGTLSVIAIRSAHDIAVEQTVVTQKGTRLGAVDSSSGRVYLPAAKFGPPEPPSPFPTVLPGTFQILVVAPQ
jgi:DNA-binding beta-propeller fold protein YncE